MEPSAGPKTLRQGTRFRGLPARFSLKTCPRAGFPSARSPWTHPGVGSWRGDLCWRCLLRGGRSQKVRTRLKYANQSKGSGFEQAPSRAFRFIRYAADAAFGCLRQPFQALSALSYQPSIDRCYQRYPTTKHKLQGSVCAADRASRSDDETAWRTTDRACSYLTASTLFHKPLKLTLYRPSLTGGTTKDRQAAKHRREVFFARLSFSKESAVSSYPSTPKLYTVCEVNSSPAFSTTLGKLA